MKRSRSEDFYKTWKSIRKPLIPEETVMVSDKDKMKCRRDRSWLNPDIDEGVSEEVLDEIYDVKGEESEHFNLEEWNKKFNEKPVKK